MNILVTGATGFIGSHICQRLFDQNFSVFALGNKGRIIPKCTQFFQLNLDGIPWNMLPSKIDVCIHQAANNFTQDKDVANMIQSNVISPSTMFYRLFEEKKCRHFIYASSSSVYGNANIPHMEFKTKLNPLTPYAKSKMQFEQFAQIFGKEKNCKVVGLRYSNVYGPNEYLKDKRASMVYQILQNVMKNEKPKLFKFGEQKRDWVYVDDVVNANILALNYKDTNIFNVGSGESISINRVLEIINQELNTNVVPEFIDCDFESTYQKEAKLDLESSTCHLGYKPEMSAEKRISQFVKNMIRGANV